jgi:hypothetical protein
MPDRDLTVTCHGHLVANGVWRIEARVRFRGDVNPRPGDEFLGRGRLALLEAVAREGARGRALGATSVRVRMQVGDDVSQFDLGHVPDLPH